MPIINLEQISKLIGLTQRQVNKLAKEKGFPRLRRGQYDEVACVHWYIAYIKQGVTDEHRDEMHVEELREIQTRNNLLEIKLARERGEVITIADVGRAVEPGFAAIRSILLGIPKHAARELANPAIEAYLDNHIRKSLDELSNIPNNIRSLARTDLVDAAKGVRDAQTASKAHRKRVGRSVSRAQQRGKRRKRPVGHGKGRVSKRNHGRHHGSKR